MAEIKRDIQKLTEGKSYTAGPDSYLITEDHTLADIIRFAISQASGVEEIAALVEELATEKEN